MGDPFAHRRLTAKEFQHWMWYEQVEPFGELRADYRAALVASEVANSVGKYRRTPKDGKMFTVEERLLRFGVKESKPVRQSPEEQVRILKIWAMALAGAKE